MSSSRDTRRFEIACDAVSAPFLRALGLGDGHIVLTPDDLIVRFGWAFNAVIPRHQIRSAEHARKPFGFGWGVHGWRGRWVVNGSNRGMVRLQLLPGITVRTAFVPIHPRELFLSLENPDGFLDALKQPA